MLCTWYSMLVANVNLGLGLLGELTWCAPCERWDRCACVYRNKMSNFSTTSLWFMLSVNCFKSSLYSRYFPHVDRPGNDPKRSRPATVTTRVLGSQAGSKSANGLCITAWKKIIQLLVSISRGMFRLSYLFDSNINYTGYRVILNVRGKIKTVCVFITLTRSSLK